MSEEIIRSKEMRLRLSQLEYEDFSKEKFQSEIERIYLEEYGEKLPADVEVFSSSEAKLENDGSGYVGTAIHFRSEKNNINEMYVVSQGTKDTEDWLYNIKAMLAGKDDSQAEATDEFVNRAKENFDVSKSTSVTGLSHSLAHNNNATAHLLHNTFDNIYSVNGAQTNYYQIYNNDKEFRQAVNNEFSISSKGEVYDIDPTRLEDFSEDYYKEEGKDIHQIISKNDPLFAVSGARGFFTLGNVDPVDTNPDYPGLRDIMDEIPDEDAQELQELAIQYASATKDGDMNDGIQDLTGINVDLINKLQDDTISTYVTDQKELDQMVHDMDEKVPELLEQVKKVTANSDTIFQKFVDAGYINADQKALIKEELMNIQSELEGVEETLSNWSAIRGQSASWYSGGAAIGADLGSYMSIVMQHKSAILDSFDRLNQKDLRSVLSMIQENHSIPSVLEAISDGNKSYKGDDMLLTGSGKSGDIQVNISAAMRMYTKGQSLLEDKKEQIKKLQEAVEHEIKDYYQDKKKDVKKQIDDIEANPKSYSFLLKKHLPTVGINKEVEDIQVEEEMDSLEHADMEDEMDHLLESVEKGNSYIERYRSSIEDLFDEEENVSAMFDLAEEVWS